MKLTIKERAWVEEVNEVLSRCPSKRLGFFTIGDPSVGIYDRTREGEIDTLLDMGKWEFCTAANSIEALAVATLEFPAAVQSTAG